MKHLIKKGWTILSPGIFPFSICLFLSVFIIFYRFLNLPSPQELTVLIIKWFDIYGLWLLAIAAFIEGVFIIGIYFPGSLAIALAVFTLGKTPLDLVYIGGISFFSFLIANIINYYIGKYGYYKLLLLVGKKDTISKMQDNMRKHGNRIFLLTGWFPNIIAITSVCAGISSLNIFKTVFYLATSLLFWVTLWTITGSLIIKNINLQDNNQLIYVLLIIFLWGAFLVFKENYKKAKHTSTPSNK